ncbi:MAG: ATP12 family protein [Erythrobacter sp.]|uniref:ATP12 family protein n=1 Tax=Erythrobacter sp. TaxID=1042 RepID=UPI0026048EFF|nr:ATP12 family protein [Erythrobacter sp.]MDJ0979825.1 ATP12 family protein [Erythrobacter sp.]
MKRFYHTVGTREEDGVWRVTLDDRPLKTVRGAAQRVPTKALANALAREWDIDGEELDPRAFPLRDMVDYTIDIVTSSRKEIADKLVAFADTDTLLYRADPDDPLFQRQQEVWEPIVIAFESRHDVSLRRVSGVVHAQQDEAAMRAVRDSLDTLDPFALTGLEAMTSLAASLTIGMSALEPDADPLSLWGAASLEEEWQADAWGRDEEAEERRRRRQTDFLRACEFTRLARGTHT